MATYHKVQQGECLSSIAKTYGFTNYRAIYDHPKNALLKKKRPDPNVLLPGDCLFIPEKQDKQEARGTDRQHHFEVRRPTVLLRLVLRDEEDRPYADASYVLTI